MQGKMGDLNRRRGMIQNQETAGSTIMVRALADGTPACLTVTQTLPATLRTVP